MANSTAAHKRRAAKVQKRAAVSATRLAALERQLEDARAETVQAKLELQRHRSKFDLVFNSVPALIWIKDRHNTIVRVNQAAADSIGVPAAEIEGRRTATFYPDEAAKYHQDDLEVINAQKPKLGIVELVQTRDGKKLWVQTDKVPLRDREGRVIGIIVVAQDITARKELDERVQHASKMEAVGQLAGGIAHDFNNLLSVIQGCTELVKMRLLKESPLQAELNVIQDALQRGAGLTRQMLAFGRSQVLEPEKLNVNTLLKSLAPLLTRLITERIELKLDMNPAVGEIFADSVQIGQALINLALNARDAIPGAGTLTIRTRTSVDGPPAETPASGPGLGPWVCITVEDTGVGMDTETQQRLFEPYFTTKPVGKGSGLGLATVYGILKQSGGSITATSQIGRGSVFSIYLPSHSAR